MYKMICPQIFLCVSVEGGEGWREERTGEERRSRGGGASRLSGAPMLDSALRYITLLQQVTQVT